MKILRTTQFGNPILRGVSRHLKPEEIRSDVVQALIADMRYNLSVKKFGIGLAAPQVGRDLALSVIDIKPTPNRPELEKFEMVIINPRIVETYGKRQGMWEGCISAGPGTSTLFARALRYKRIRISFLDEHAQPHEADFDGLAAHVLQHETDHLNGILFVDRVRDTRTYMTEGEYRKHIVKK